MEGRNHTKNLAASDTVSPPGLRLIIEGISMETTALLTGITLGLCLTSSEGFLAAVFFVSLPRIPNGTKNVVMSVVRTPLLPYTSETLLTQAAKHTTSSMVEDDASSGASGGSLGLEQPHRDCSKMQVLYQHTIVIL